MNKDWATEYRMPVLLQALSVIRIMRTTLLLQLLFFTKTLWCQASIETKYDVTIKLPSYITSKTIDTLFILDTKTNIQTKHFDLKQKEQIVVLGKLTKGKYLLTLAGQGYLIEQYPIVVCSKCDSSLDLSKFPNQRTLTKEMWNLVAVGPGYVGGNYQIRADFLSNFSKEEIQELKTIKQFRVEGFLTSALEVCDLSFVNTKLKDSQKTLIIRGLMNLKNWQSARTNGRPVDGKFIFENLRLR